VERWPRSAERTLQEVMHEFRCKIAHEALPDLGVYKPQMRVHRSRPRPSPRVRHGYDEIPARKSLALTPGLWQKPRPVDTTSSTYDAGRRRDPLATSSSRTSVTGKQLQHVVKERMPVKPCTFRGRRYWSAARILVSVLFFGRYGPVLCLHPRFLCPANFLKSLAQSGQHAVSMFLPARGNAYAPVATPIRTTVREPGCRSFNGCHNSACSGPMRANTKFA